ncbi:MAG TPA: hypothetical protein VNL37_00110, partial [Candidatus Polarisedimenticolia bacterium]|nr:hypothetical protein [Candidatus Polarisedimenticolia bacterium]
DPLNVKGTVTDDNHLVAIYNQAVKVANAGHLDDAISILERLLPQIRNDDLAAQTRALLERMKRDRERLKAKRPGAE